MYNSRVCRLGLRLIADGGLQLPAQCQRLDLMDREDWAQVDRSEDLCRPLALGDGLKLLPAVRGCPRPGTAAWVRGCCQAGWLRVGVGWGL